MGLTKTLDSTTQVQDTERDTHTKKQVLQVFRLFLFSVFLITCPSSDPLT